MIGFFPFRLAIITAHYTQSLNKQHVLSGVRWASLGRGRWLISQS